MSQTTVLMKLIAFIALMSAVLLVIAMDENFKEFEAYREGFTKLGDALADNPLDELSAAQKGQFPEDDAITTGSKKTCWIKEWCPDLPTDQISEWLTDVATAVWGFVETVIEFIRTGVNVIGVLFTILVLVVSFTIPGIPFIVQALLWAFALPIWMAIFYIAFRAIRGGG